ncbi:MAG: polyprenyl diphosphate synthase [Succinivibrio sp.]
MQDTSENLGGLVAPRHLAIIMDGNGRWAVSRGKPRVSGHREGANAVRRVIAESARLGVKELTLFAFSSENWKRPALEVNALMTLFVQAIKSESKNLLKNGIKTRIVGDKSRFPALLQEQIAKVEKLTEDCQVMTLNIAANYGGRWDILQAVQSIVKDCSEGKINNNELIEDSISQRLAVQTDVDLMIRTGGEKRISNFLLWQCGYAELYFSDTLWPDYDRDDLIEAFRFFNSRERRFGMTSAQVQNKDNIDVN